MSATSEQYDIYGKTLDLIYNNPESVNDKILQDIDYTGDYLESAYESTDGDFSISSFLKERDKEIERLGISSEDETMYGYQPPSWMPDWIKAGYQNSVTGLTERIRKGQPIKEYDLNLLEDVGATLISFIQPLDIATMAIGGGVGGFGARTVMKEGAKQAIKQGLKKGAAKKFIANKIDDKVAMKVLGSAPKEAIEMMVGAGIKENIATKAVMNAAPRVTQKALIQAAGGGGGLGFYSGLQTALTTKVTTGDVDEVMALKEGLKGAVLGAVTGGTQPIARSYLRGLKKPTTNTQKFVQETAVKAMETAEFGTIAPVLSGEDISLEGYVHAAATIGGLTAQRYAWSSAKKGFKAMRGKKYDSVMDAEDTARYIMEEPLPEKKSKGANVRNVIETEEVFVNSAGEKYDQLKFNDVRKEITLRNKATQKESVISYDTFNSQMFSRESSAKTPAGLARGRAAKIANLQRKLGLSDDKIKEYSQQVKVDKAKDESKIDPASEKVLDEFVSTGPGLVQIKKSGRQYDSKYKASSTWYRNLYELTHQERTYTAMGEDAMIGKTSQRSLDKAHRKAIKDAVKKGLPVRKEVLNDPVVGVSKKVGDPIKPPRLKVEPKDPKGLRGLNAVEQVKLLNELRHEKRISDLKESFLAAGWENDLLPKKRLLDELAPTLPKVWRQAKNRVSTQLGLLSMRELNKADALELVTFGSYIQELRSAGLFEGGLFKKKKFLEHYEGISDKLEDPRYVRGNEKLGASLPDYNKVIEIRDVLGRMWDRAKEAGIDLGPKEEFYFPRVIKPEFLAMFSKDIANIGKENPSLIFDKKNMNEKKFQDLIVSYAKNGKLDPNTVLIIESLGGVTKRVVKDNKGNIVKEEITDSPNEYARKIAMGMFELNEKTTVQFHNIAKHVELARTVENIPNQFLERDARLVLSRYTKQLSRRISFVENFGRKGEKFLGRISALRRASFEENQKGNFKLSEKLREEARLLDQLFKSYTNKIEIDPTYNWKTPTARKFWSDVTNLEIGTKIGLGFATIPNITQLFISTAVKTGYMPLIKGTYKLATDAEYRNEIRKSGVSNLSVFQLIAGLEPSEGWTSNFANITTKATGFQLANKINQMVSAAAAKEWISSLQKTATGKSALLDIGIPTPFGGTKRNRRNWAIKNLESLGIKDPNTNLKNKKGKQLELEAMYRFSRDSQLQRNVINEAPVMLDPRWRPFFLFKKFGFKQMNWMREQLLMEVERGNLFPMLRLAVGGMAGGEMVSWARDSLAEYIAGQKVYDDNRYLYAHNLPEAVPMTSYGMSQGVDMRDFTIDDFVDRFASVGAFGMIGDIVANENRVRALEFAFKPAVVQDFNKIWSAMTRTLEDTKDYGIGAALRMPKYLGPLIGTIPKRGLERIEPAGQREAYVKRLKQIRLPEIKEALLEGDNKQATRIINNFNNAFGNENPILPEDYDPTKLTDFLIRKIKKRQNP